MKRILIFSDTHGNIKKATEIINNIPCDLIIHLGDLVRDAKELEKLFPHIPFEYVCGNNDYFGTDYIKVVNFEGINIFCTHGHLYTLDKMVEKAKNLNCTFALFGHTHRSMNQVQEGIRIFNPGSISRPRDDSPSYGVLEIENNIPKIAIIKEKL